MAKIIKKKVSWTASTASDVEGYKVYWSTEANGEPDYDADNVEVSATQVIFPDDTPTFPVAEEGNYILGVAAVDDVGNESDMAVTSPVPFDFNAPDAPSNVIVENI